MKTASILTLAALLLCPGRAAADSTGDSIELSVNEPRERFKRGVDLFREANYDAALAEFNKAYELAPNYRVLYNLAQVQAERHEYVAALRLLAEYVERGADEIPDNRRDQVDSIRRRLKSRIAVLWVHTSTPATELLLDGVSAGMLPMTTPVLVNAGVHRVQLRRSGEDTTGYTLTIAGNETVRLELPAPTPERPAVSASTVPAKVDVDLRVRSDPPAESAATRAAHSAPSGGSQLPTSISLTAAALLAGGAVTFGALAHTSSTALDRELSRLPADHDRVGELRSELKRNAAVSDVLTTAAVIGAGLALYFALSGSSTADSVPVPPREPDNGTAALGLGPVQQ